MQRVSSSRFVGRETELAELRRALGGDSPLPAVVFLAGESGVGKSRLLAELIAAAEADGVRVIGGSCVELAEGEMPYAPLVSALRPLHRTCEPILDELSAESRAQLARLSPEIGGAGAAAAGDGERGEAQLWLFEAFLELIARLGEDGPVLFWIEDVHWADSSTRAFLRFLAASLREENVLVVATYRADELHRRHPLRPLLAELERTPLARRMDLDRFDRDELAEQLADILDREPTDDVVERLYGRSEGNPLFTEELLAAGIDGLGPLPPSMREALMLRIERLSPDCRQVLRALAVAGTSTEAVLGEATGLEPAAVAAGLRAAMDAQIAVLDGERFGFRHAILREVLYEDLLPGERAELHLCIATAIEATAGGSRSPWEAAAVAHHFQAGGDQPRALSAAVSASSHVRSLHANHEAAALLDRAVALWPRVDDPEGASGMSECELLEAAARAHYWAGEEEIAATLFERAIARLEEAEHDADPEQVAGLLEGLAVAQWSLGRSEQSRVTQKRALDLLPSDEVTPTRARLLAQQARFLMLQGRFAEACEVAPEALAATEELGMDSERPGVLNRYGYALFAMGEEAEGAERMEESIRLSETTGRDGDLATAYANYADAFHFAGHTHRAWEIAGRGLREISERLERHGGSPRAASFIRLDLAGMSFDLGDWAGADEELRRAGMPALGVNRAHAQTPARPARARPRPRGRGRGRARGGLRAAPRLARAAVPRSARRSAVGAGHPPRRLRHRAQGGRRGDRPDPVLQRRRGPDGPDRRRRNRGRGGGGRARPRPRRRRRAGRGHGQGRAPARAGPGGGRGPDAPDWARAAGSRRGRRRSRPRHRRAAALGGGGRPLARGPAALPGGERPLARGAGVTRQGRPPRRRRGAGAGRFARAPDRRDLAARARSRGSRSGRGCRWTPPRRRPLPRPRRRRRFRSASPPASFRSSSSSATAARTARSASASTWRRRPPASTSRGSSPSSGSAAEPRRRRSPTATGSGPRASRPADPLDGLARRG